MRRGTGFIRVGLAVVCLPTDRTSTYRSELRYQRPILGRRSHRSLQRSLTLGSHLLTEEQVQAHPRSSKAPEHELPVSDARWHIPMPKNRR